MTDEDNVILNIPPGASTGVPMGNIADRADILEKIKPEHHPDLIRKRFLGKETIAGQEFTIRLPEKSKLSEFGAWDITTSMLGFGSIGTSISKLNDREIKNRLHRIVKEVLYKSLSRWREYNISDVSMFYTIKEIVFTQALVVLKQADDASIQELLKGVVHEQRNITGEVKKEGRLRRMTNSLMGR